jgi:hypothetical protein
MNWPLRVTIIACATLSLSACMLFGGPADRALRKTPSYREGYSDGCAAANNPSANYREGPSADNELYQTDKIYRRGWASGYQTCQPNGLPQGDTPYNPAQGPTPATH